MPATCDYCEKEDYMSTSSNFIFGVNYWPRHTAMGWWSSYDQRQVSHDFEQLAGCRLQVVRIFLTWEVFQPRIDEVSPSALEKLYNTAQIARRNNLYLMPTFFCGHMSGVNWLPCWLLDRSNPPGRFPVYTEGKLHHLGAANFFVNEDLLAAQVRQIEAVCSTLKGHPALYAYDLGNETSNCLAPSGRNDFRNWLKILRRAVAACDPETPVTIGMHAEDLEQNRYFWPQDAAHFCDFLSMHGYPFYLSWADDKLDPLMPAFLGVTTAWLGEKPVLFQEFGAPTLPQIAPLPGPGYIKSLSCPLWSEEEVCSFYKASQYWLQKSGMLGAMGWCAADYIPALWGRPPLDTCPHERHFGLFRHDGSPKKALEVFPGPLEAGDPLHLPENWPTCSRRNYFDNPQQNLQKMYTRFKQIVKEDYA